MDQILGGVFFLAALGLLVLFVDLLARFWSDDALPDHPALRLALRYGMIAALYAFGVGVIMSLVGGRTLGAGNMMPLHAAGFHGVQAVTLIALVAGATSIVDARVATHIAGGGWLLLCTGLLVQALAGVAPTTPAPGLYLAAIGMVVWLGGAVLALMPRAAAVGVVRQE
ncbi:MAG: hypothetical protein H0V12_02380 [Chloroflexi bacterium]|nr:hypothetical protein [Chloroflexota bacterium]